MDVKGRRLETKKAIDEIDEIEQIFVHKLSEKYELSERGIMKAIGLKAGTDGKILISELETAVIRLLNGFEKGKIQSLIHHYDIDGSGSIKLNEFCKYLISRCSSSREVITIRNLIAAETLEKSDVNLKSDFGLAAKVDNVLRSLRAAAVERILNLRNNGRLKSYEYRGMHLSSLTEAIYRQTLLRSCQSMDESGVEFKLNFSNFCG